MTIRRRDSLIGLAMLTLVAGSLGGAIQTVGQMAAGYDGPLKNDDDAGRPHRGETGMDTGMDPRTGNGQPAVPVNPTVSSTTLPRTGDVDRIPERMPGHH
jgi:hypothetical protein